MTLFLAFGAMALCWGCKSHSADKVSGANATNEKKTNGKDPKEAAAKFLVSITDGRLMDIREGEEAVKKGTTAAIREYGQMMLRDQKAMLEKITVLASERQLVLPQDIGNKKEEGFKELDEKQHAEFDKKFIKMMKRDHERDIRELKKGAKIGDAGIQQFAIANLPVVQAHLAKLEAIEKSLK